MRIALFSDIHANLPALEACLESIDAQKPDAIYCLGDLVGYNVWPNEVIDLIEQKGIPTIAGNYDYGIGLGIDDCGCAYKTTQEKEMGKISIRFTNEVIGANQRSFLKALPRDIRITPDAGGKKLSLLLVHGSPRKINEYLYEDRDDKSYVRLFAQAQADILCFGHTHLPFHKTIKSYAGDAERYLHAINTGSVGKPKDGDPRGGYILLDVNTQNSSSVSSIQTKIVRFDYDIEKAAKAILQSDLPNAYAESLRTGH
jgi:predicted phosphodiesterase